MAGERLEGWLWDRAFAGLERLSPAPEAMTTEKRLDCAAIWFCLVRGQDLEEREQARQSAEWRVA